jgi:hypothetical protein
MAKKRMIKDKALRKILKKGGRKNIKKDFFELLRRAATSLDEKS